MGRANLRLDNASMPSKAQILQQVPPDELMAWFVAGAQEVANAVRSAPRDVAARVFLNHAPPPRQFWARRQAHETTIHAADAAAATLGRLPRAEEVHVDRDVALDGIDELLTGFFTRGPSKVAQAEPFTVVVTPVDASRAWLLRVDDATLTAERRDTGCAADVTFSATAAQLYLGLWNRGAEITVHGQAAPLERWQRFQRVRWS